MCILEVKAFKFSFFSSKFEAVDYVENMLVFVFIIQEKPTIKKVVILRNIENEQNFASGGVNIGLLFSPNNSEGFEEILSELSFVSEFKVCSEVVRVKNLISFIVFTYRKVF